MMQYCECIKSYVPVPLLVQTSCHSAGPLYMFFPPRCNMYILNPVRLVHTHALTYKLFKTPIATILRRCICWSSARIVADSVCHAYMDTYTYRNKHTYRHATYMILNDSSLAGEYVFDVGAVRCGSPAYASERVLGVQNVPPCQRVVQFQFVYPICLGGWWDSGCFGLWFGWLAGRSACFSTSSGRRRIYSLSDFSENVTGMSVHAR